MRWGEVERGEVRVGRGLGEGWAPEGGVHGVGEHVGAVGAEHHPRHRVRVPAWCRRDMVEWCNGGMVQWWNGEMVEVPPISVTTAFFLRSQIFTVLSMPADNTWPGVRCQVPGDRCQVSGDRYQV